MSAISTYNKKRPYRAFMSVCMAFLVVFGLFNGFLVKTALAYVPSNDYVDSLQFFDTYDGIGILQFHCKATFPLASNPAYRIIDLWDGASYYQFFLTCDGAGCDDYITPHLTDNSFVAGYTYKIYGTALLYAGTVHLTEEDISRAFVSTDALMIANIFFPEPYGDNIGLAYFQELPTLTITYPLDDAELLANFYITGSFTQPSPYIYHWLQAYFNPVGWEFTNVFGQTISVGGVGVATGTIAIWVSGIAQGYYDFEIYMLDTENNSITYPTWNISNIHIVNDLPPSLPPYGEQPPSTAPPAFEPLEPGAYYTENSTYATPTPLWITITGTFAPVLLSVGQNLTDFASGFTLSNASSTGNQLGQSILLVRTYVSSINSFFADFPVGQFLLLYLIALVVIIVLRLIKGLINLFKI